MTSAQRLGANLQRAAIFSAVIASPLETWAMVALFIISVVGQALYQLGHD